MFQMKEGDSRLPTSESALCDRIDCQEFRVRCATLGEANRIRQLEINRQEAVISDYRAKLLILSAEKRGFATRGFLALSLIPGSLGSFFQEKFAAAYVAIDPNTSNHN